MKKESEAQANASERYKRKGTNCKENNDGYGCPTCEDLAEKNRPFKSGESVGCPDY
jgi:hypothetical protein